MQATTEKLCCSDVFSQKFVGSPASISCFSRTARRRIERSRPWISCSVRCRTSSNRLNAPPTNSPDLNPVDHGVWGALQQSVYRIPISNSDDLNDRVRTCWENLDQRNEQIIDKFRAVLTNGRSGHVPRAPDFFLFEGPPTGCDEINF